MPRKVRGKAGVNNAQGAQGVENVQDTAATPNKAQHPRAQTIAQQNEQSHQAVTARSRQLLDPQIQPLRRSTRERKEPVRFSSLTFPEPGAKSPPVKKTGRTTGKGKRTSQNLASAPTNRRQNTVSQPKAPRRPTNRSQSKKTETRTSQNPGLTLWLEQVQPGSPEDLRRLPRVEAAPVTNLAKQTKGNMDETTNTSSNSASRNPLEGEYESTAKASKPRKQKALTWDKLRARNIENEPSEDSKLQILKGRFKLDLPPLLGEQTATLKEIWDKFFEQAQNNPKANCLPALESATDEYRRYRHQIYLATVTNREFAIDIARCKMSNEAVLQGAIMQTVIDRYQFHEILDYNCDGQWYQPRENQVPSRQDDEVSLPRPDLAMSFRFKSLSKEDRSAPIPAHIADCIRPDGAGRCFPFLFMEAKKAATDLDEALRQNMNSASQALLNIYKWMSQAGKDEIFAQDVRVFSVVLNAIDFSVRIHRAKPGPNDTLAYDFDELSPLERYGKDQACLLIRSILDRYAIEELHGILQETFKEVSRQEDVWVQSKRKTQNTRRASSKRPRTGPDDGQDARGSFGMSGVALSPS